MISPRLTNKTLNKIKKLFSINPNDKIYLPIINNPSNLEIFIKFFSNKFVVSIPNYTVYSSILKNQFLARQFLKRKIEFNMDFFGVSSKIPLEKVSKAIIFFPSNLALNLLTYALHQLFKLFSQPTAILIITSHKKQNEVVLKWANDARLEYSKTKSQDKVFYIIPEFNPSNGNQYDFEDYTFKIRYKKGSDDFEFFSSDGVFSKEKIDEGTDFLIETILNKELIPNNAEIIDYFAGIGVIGLVLSKFIDLKKVHFIESDIISLFLLKRNLKHYHTDNSIVHEMDGLEEPNIIPKTIDFILANPPTHIRKEDFKHFLQISSQLLKNQGKLIIVINTIIPYELTLKEYFPNPSEIVSYRKNKYKIIVN
jgi:16S rRNA (guanine1207-N2)-methyltransferase